MSLEVCPGRKQEVCVLWRVEGWVAGKAQADDNLVWWPHASMSVIGKSPL